MKKIRYGFVLFLIIGIILVSGCNNKVGKATNDEKTCMSQCIATCSSGITIASPTIIIETTTISKTTAADTIEPITTIVLPSTSESLVSIAPETTELFSTTELSTTEVLATTLEVTQLPTTQPPETTAVSRECIDDKDCRTRFNECYKIENERTALHNYKCKTIQNYYLHTSKKECVRNDIICFQGCISEENGKSITPICKDSIV